MPSRCDSVPAATFLTTTSIGTISTWRINCSRMFRRRMKWVGMPIVPRSVKICSEMRLLSTPLPEIVPFFCALNAVASSLKYWMSVPGSGPS